MSLELGNEQLIACLCEGSAEQTIINLLLDADALIFSREQLIDEKPIKTRSAREFERRYLRCDFESPITVLRILDSHNEKFKLKAEYQTQIGNVYNIVTAPEIEILIIITEGHYERFSNKSHLKPSEYCEQEFKFGRKIKQETFIRNYYKKSEDLKAAIQQYAKYCKRKPKEYCLNDLLK